MAHKRRNERTCTFNGEAGAGKLRERAPEAGRILRRSQPTTILSGPLGTCGNLSTLRVLSAMSIRNQCEALQYNRIGSRGSDAMSVGEARLRNGEKAKKGETRGRVRPPCDMNNEGCGS